MDLRTDFDQDAGELSVVAEDLGRVFINMVSNACYALDEKRQASEAKSESFTPTLVLTTKRIGESVEPAGSEITGREFPPNIMEKMFSPLLHHETVGKGGQDWD